MEHIVLRSTLMSAMKWTIELFGTKGADRISMWSRTVFLSTGIMVCLLSYLLAKRN